MRLGRKDKTQDMAPVSDLVKGEGEECASGRLKRGQFWLDIKCEKPGFLQGWVPRRHCPQVAPRLTQRQEEEK